MAIDRSEVINTAIAHGSGGAFLELSEDQGDVTGYQTKGKQTRVPAFSKVGLDMDKVRSSIKHVVIEQEEESILDDDGNVLDTTIQETKRTVDDASSIYSTKDKIWQKKSQEETSSSTTSQKDPKKNLSDKRDSEQICTKTQVKDSKFQERGPEVKALISSINDLVSLFQNQAKSSLEEDQSKEAPHISQSQSTSTPIEKEKTVEMSLPELKDVKWDTSVGSFSCSVVKVVTDDDFAVVVYLADQKDKYIPNPSGDSSLILNYDGKSVEVKSYGISFDLDLEGLSYTLVILVPVT